MKRTSFAAYIVGIASLFGSCSKDYLETKPTDAIVPETAFSTTDGGYKAINGIARLMTYQWALAQGLSGEGTIKMYYGNYPGANFVKDLTGWSPIINSQYHENVTSQYDYYPWWYYYTLIDNANVVLDRIDKASGADADKKMITAQALTYRAYSYFMLSQLYCFRWADSNNGATDGLVLRTKPDNKSDVPLSTLAQVYTQVYTDLDNAIKLFDESGRARKNIWELDASVAKAVYARAALTRQDYQKAADMAKAARAGHPLMSNAEYKAGFCNPNNEWIWGSYGGENENLYYFSYFSYMAYNSSASMVRSYPLCISKELYNKIPSTDIRKNLWYGTSTDNTSFIKDPVEDAAVRAAHPKIAANAKTAYYMQFKVACNVTPGVGYLNHFRSAEMYLIEAEALARLGGSANETAAQNLLVELNSQRDNSYTCTKTSAALVDEVMLYRSVELWGEGFDWFDLKRTGATLVRHDKSKGGNFLTLLAVSIAPQETNAWTWKIPNKETDFNFEIDKLVVK